MGAVRCAWSNTRRRTGGGGDMQGVCIGSETGGKVTTCEAKSYEMNMKHRGRDRLDHSDRPKNRTGTWCVTAIVRSYRVCEENKNIVSLNTW